MQCFCLQNLDSYILSAFAVSVYESSSSELSNILSLKSVLFCCSQDAARYRDELQEISPHSLLKCSSDFTTLVCNEAFSSFNKNCKIINLTSAISQLLSLTGLLSFYRINYVVSFFSPLFSCTFRLSVFCSYS